MDSSRLRKGEIIAAIGGVALFIFLFLDWFGAGPAEASGWDGLGGDFSGFVVFSAALAGVALALMGAAGQRLNIDLPRGFLTAALGDAAVVMIVLQIFATPEGADVKFGLFLGLAAAIAIAVGALLALREGGFEPVVAVAGGGTRAASSASAPAAKPAAKPAPKPATRSRSTASKKSGGSTRAKPAGSKASSRSSTTRKRSTSAKKK